MIIFQQLDWQDPVVDRGDPLLYGWGGEGGGKGEVSEQSHPPPAQPPTSVLCAITEACRGKGGPFAFLAHVPVKPLGRPITFWGKSLRGGREQVSPRRNCHLGVFPVRRAACPL